MQQTPKAPTPNPQINPVIPHPATSWNNRAPVSARWKKSALSKLDPTPEPAPTRIPDTTLATKNFAFETEQLFVQHNQATAPAVWPETIARKSNNAANWTPP